MATARHATKTHVIKYTLSQREQINLQMLNCVHYYVVFGRFLFKKHFSVETYTVLYACPFKTAILIIRHGLEGNLSTCC